MSRAAKSGSNDNVKVMVRVRPFNDKEIAENGGEIPFCTVRAREGVVQTCDPYAPDEQTLRQEFAFDWVFWSIPSSQIEADVPFATQEDVFEKAGLPAVDNLFDGFNGCIFAYGQTSSGKTHTMMGWTPPDSERGITPRLCEVMFDRMDQMESACRDIKMTQGRLRKVEFTVTLSFLEIYNEKVQDLLTAKRDREDALRVQYDPIIGPTVQGLKIVEVKSWRDVKRQFALGNEQRTTAATAMNQVSSRSHAVVQLTVQQNEVVAYIKGKPKNVIRKSRINLVDLAGSEKTQKSMVTGIHMKEAIGINQSLTCLGRVIDALVKGERHVPYRDSVLTQLLSDSLGGNSRTTMVATISPAAVNFEETVSTLRYASRARLIVNVVKVNEDPTAQLIRELQEELAQLKLGMGMEPGATWHGERAAEAHEVEAMLQQLQSRESEAQHRLEEQEEEWARERAEIEIGHQRAVSQLENEKEQLLQERYELQEKTTQLETVVHAQQVEKDMMQRQHDEAQAEAAAKQAALRRQRVIDRFRQASDKSRAQAAKMVTNKELNDLRLEASTLRRALQDRDRELAQRPPKYRGMYIGQFVDRNSGAIICEMCYECNATRVCHDCGGDHLCELCDFNQHRSTQTRYHQRAALPTGLVEGVILCEFCGVKRAVWTCAECINGRLCEDCDDIKHRNKRRNFHHRFAGVTVALGPEEMRAGAVARPLVDETTNPRVTPRNDHTIATPTYPFTHHTRLEQSHKSLAEQARMKAGVVGAAGPAPTYPSAGFPRNPAGGPPMAPGGTPGYPSLFIMPKTGAPRPGPSPGAQPTSAAGARQYPTLSMIDNMPVIS